MRAEIQKQYSDISKIFYMNLKTYLSTISFSKMIKVRYNRITCESEGKITVSGYSGGYFDSYKNSNILMCFKAHK